MFKIQLIGYLLKEGFVDKINENLVKNEDASKHVIEKIRRSEAIDVEYNSLLLMNLLMLKIKIIIVQLIVIVC